MLESRAGSLALVGGSWALDFANTAAGRGTATPVEHLPSPGSLVAWAAHAGVLDATSKRQAEAAVSADAAAARKLLRGARQLRGAIYAVGAAIARGEAPQESDLRILKAFAERTLAAAALAPAVDGRFKFDFTHAPAEAALLGRLAWSAIDLLATVPPERIKQCPGHGCGWLFLDVSKNNSRRWCDMATCGNRTKATRFRQRH
ncbi:CGNR zinc finger domain-containing protein [Vineibacter terrae]|uniref:CGNR zinc finger domain-containing protein n=1 Tax=Vineibacter terrae TaxID=2586908 RepID=UPI002E329C59|nr:ABATE domain-containing protein [Vineibacter terrae]HEX2886302.1 ABATE domain-containing protein [Vineibacter terrae]